LSLKIRFLSSKGVPAEEDESDLVCGSCLDDMLEAETASLKEIVPSRTVSSTLNPAFRSVRRPFSMPASPPMAYKAAWLFGLNRRPSWPGEKANLLLSTLKRSSVPGSGERASRSSVALEGTGLTRASDSFPPEVS
jgi:hypothetical protein